MKINVLDKRTLKQGGSFLLGKVSLLDYISNLPSNFFNFDIQRSIVSNKYLDRILDSVYNEEPLPPITLLDNNNMLEVVAEYSLQDFSILDGLQRTYRLWLYYRIVQILQDSVDSLGYMDVVKKLMEEEPNLLKIIPLKNIKSLFDKHSNLSVENLVNLYKSYKIYLYVWSNLSDKQIINEMLKLNVGQKRVTLVHQFELLYLPIYKKCLNKGNDIILVREKDSRYFKVKRGDREVGELLFASVIVALISFVSGKAMRISNQIKIDLDEDDKELSQSFYSPDYINDFLLVLLDLDRHLSSSSDLYKKWFVKDTTLSGILAAMGAYIREMGKVSNDNEFFQISINSLRNIINNLEYPDPFDLLNFEQNYASLSSLKVSIGTVVRKAIQIYTYELISIKSKKPDWSNAFKLASNGNKGYL